MKKKYFGASRYKVEPLFKEHYSLSEGDWKRLHDLWHKYGMRVCAFEKERTSSNHFYLQGIVEHLVIEWHNWEKGMSPELKKIIKEEFPQLMVTDQQFSID